MKSFLLIDDDADDADLFREALAEIDKSIVLHCAIDGQDALTKLNCGEVKNPDIIFLDINMPVMDGWQCLISLKSNLRYYDLPVIMFSTSPDQKNVDRALNLGALCFFTKPDDYSTLKEILSVVANNSDNGSILNAISKFNNIRSRHVFACS